MALLYAAAVMGAYSLFRADCDRAGECFTQSRVALAVASSVAGFHIIFMLGAVVWMFVEIWRVRQAA